MASRKPPALRARTSNEMIHEAVISCPWCWERNHLSVDCSAGDAEIVEDCTVCCRPMVLCTHLDASGDLAGIEVRREND